MFSRMGSVFMVPNKAFHLTAIPLRSIAAGELGRWAAIAITAENYEARSDHSDLHHSMPSSRQ